MTKSASVTKKAILLAVCIVALTQLSGFSTTVMDTGRPALDAEDAATCAEFRAPGSEAAKAARAAAAKADADAAFQAAATIPGCAPVVYKPPLDGKYHQDIFDSQKAHGPST